MYIAPIAYSECSHRAAAERKSSAWLSFNVFVISTQNTIFFIHASFIKKNAHREFLIRDSDSLLSSK
jgi:hypothetical protein